MLAGVIAQQLPYSIGGDSDQWEARSEKVLCI